MTIKDSERYAVSVDEDYEPGSNNQVLKNYLGVTSIEIISQLEVREFESAELAAFENFSVEHRFTTNDICALHQAWLREIYPFAGKFRSVNMSKGGFLFAGASYIQGCMKKFEQEYLGKYTPCHFTNIDELASALGIVHIEFILIHPFREGNGRIARLLAVLMALQAGRPPLNFETIDQTTCAAGFKKYIEAIHAGHAGDYEPITAIFKKILDT